MEKKLKKVLKKSLIFNKALFYLGYVIFKLFGKTPRVSYMSMVNIYCITNGQFLDNLNFGKKYVLNCLVR